MDVRLTMHSNFLSSSPAATQQKERERERKEMDLTSADHHAAAASTCPGCLSSTWLQDSTSPLLWCLALVLDTQSCVASCLVDSQRFQTQWVPDFSLLFRCWTSMFWLESPCVARRHTTLAVQDCVGTVWTCVHKAPQLSTWLWTHTFGTNSVGMTELQTSEDQAVVGMACRKPLDILKTCTHAGVINETTSTLRLLWLLMSYWEDAQSTVKSLDELPIHTVEDITQAFILLALFITIMLTFTIYILAFYWTKYNEGLRNESNSN